MALEVARLCQMVMHVCSRLTVGRQNGVTDFINQ